jgi:cystathionine beta-lyase/cystathionine gamma-synthase
MGPRERARKGGVRRGRSPPAKHMEFATKTIHAGQPSEPNTGAVVPPIFQTTTYQQLGPGEHRGFDYTRTNNPTRERLEGVLAALEGGTEAAVFGSGLAAENAILQAYLKPGEEIIVPGDVYGGTYRMLHNVFEPNGCIVKQVDFANPDEVSAAISPATRLVWLESPTNPRLLVYDIAEISRRAHAGGALVVVDNTFATPFFQRPFDLGADLVVHSVTKYLAGHSDLVQGAVIARDPAAFAPVKYLQNALGGIPSPFDCWLTLRGLRTLELRMLRHAENAIAVADALAKHPRVRQVYFPGLPSHPGHEIAKAQMSGFGGMVSFELDGTIEEASSFVSSLEYFALGESLGGVRSLVCLPCKMTHASIPAAERHALGLADTLIRLSPGCESAKDLVRDLVSGLDRLGAASADRLAADMVS